MEKIAASVGVGPMISSIQLSFYSPQYPFAASYFLNFAPSSRRCAEKDRIDFRGVCDTLKSDYHLPFSPLPAPPFCPFV